MVLDGAEMADGSGARSPAKWQPGDGAGQTPVIKNGHPALESMASWKLLVDVDMDLGALTGNKDKKISPWEPKFVRLTDIGVVLAIIFLSAQYRRDYLSWDFDAKGNIRSSRTGAYRLVSRIAHFLVVKGSYILCGDDWQHAGWLLADIPRGGEQIFGIGQVLAPAQTAKATALEFFCVGQNGVWNCDPPNTIWTYARQITGIAIRGSMNWDWRQLVLRKDAAGTYEWASQRGF
ncbi:hypothetical protein NUU61_006867 [Penicillium alfredii]|uniref:Uncharacterized protein n=1 Tax=Penicillium alfredii TaxID=1506179 RepID=A0A9W9K4N8_9EURO|nr:uncharacterized protein NUU61_006867 [Penicillium alfredii]KAJ5091997.1 hypothetical protein NUU61_006867 [Penicillium alfredii]